jgi:hypothetical protein
MAEAAGEMKEMEGEGLVRSDSQINLDPREKGVSATGLISKLNDLYLRDFGEGSHDLVMMLGTQDQVDISNDFHFPSQGSCKACPKDLRMIEQFLEDLASRSDDLSIAILALILFNLLDALEDLLLGFLAESLKSNQTIFQTGIFQLSNGFNIEAIVKGFDLSWSEATDLKHLQMSPRNRSFQLFMKLESASANQFFNMASDCVTDSFDLFESTFSDYAL